jgi:transcriptional regulator with XRE-family HTH domain
LLRGSDPQPEEIRRITEIFGLSEDGFVAADMLTENGVDVLRNNLTRLTGELKRGAQQQLAHDLGFHETTISNWLSGSRQPAGRGLVALCRHFALPRETDLRTEPLFLSPSPVGAREQRDWLSDRIDRLEAETLRDLFPALERILNS